MKGWVCTTARLQALSPKLCTTALQPCSTFRAGGRRSPRCMLFLLLHDSVGVLPRQGSSVWGRRPALQRFFQAKCCGLCLTQGEASTSVNNLGPSHAAFHQNVFRPHAALVCPDFSHLKCTRPLRSRAPGGKRGAGNSRAGRRFAAQAAETIMTSCRPQQLAKKGAQRWDPPQCYASCAASPGFQHAPTSPQSVPTSSPETDSSLCVPKSHDAQH